MVVFFKVLGPSAVHLSIMWEDASLPDSTKIGFLLHYADKYPKIDP
jgi:hypothetical protein